MLPSFPNVLLIGSNTRKTGKSTLICRLLERYGKEQSIAAIKLAIYDDINDLKAHYSSASDKGVYIIEEHKPGDKDSRKFLASGAHRSWFIAIMQSEIEQVVDLLNSIKNEGHLVIIESTSLRNYIIPGLFVFLYKESSNKKKREARELADMEIETGSDDFNNIDQSVCVEQDMWVFC
jgi:molybdopterin-guanine dinucleotide biosynthesis protein